MFFHSFYPNMQIKMGLEVKDSYMIRKKINFLNFWEGNALSFILPRKVMVSPGIRLIPPSLSASREVTFFSIALGWKICLLGNV